MRLCNVWMSEETGGEGSAGGDPTSFVTSNSDPVADTAGDSTESDVNWSEVAEDLIQDDAGTVEGDVEVVEPVVGAPAAAETPVAPAAPEPVVAPVQAPSADTQPITPAPAADTAAPADYQAWRATRVAELEQHYAIAEDDAAALITEPETVLPKLAAQVHMEVMENSMRAMQAMMPVMMQKIQQHAELETRGRNLFASINPDLVDPAYEPAIIQFGQVYRNVNATASPEEASRAIGSLVRAALGIAQAPTVQATPTQQVQPLTPFTPARGGGGAGRAPVSENEFTKLANEFLQDE